MKYVGAETWSQCALLSVVGVFFFLFPIGIFAFCCPCDKKDAYSVNGSVYDAAGKRLGSARNVRLFNLRPRNASGPSGPGGAPVAPAHQRNSSMPGDAHGMSVAPARVSVTVTERTLPDGRREIVKTTINSDGTRTVETTIETPQT